MHPSLSFSPDSEEPLHQKFIGTRPTAKEVTENALVPGRSTVKNVVSSFSQPCSWCALPACWWLSSKLPSGAHSNNSLNRGFGTPTTYWCLVEKGEMGWLLIPLMDSGSFEDSLPSTGKTIGVCFLLQNLQIHPADVYTCYHLSWFLRTTHFVVSFWSLTCLPNRCCSLHQVFRASICRVGPILINAITGSGSFVGLRPQKWPRLSRRDDSKLAREITSMDL